QWRRGAGGEKPAGVCGGDGCDVRDSRPLHKIHHRGTLWRLCSSCVLKYSTGSFCALCFSLLDARPPAIVRCAKCPSISHRSCLRNPNLAFICPSCKNPEGTRKLIDAGSKKVLLAAGELAANSMKKAAAAERARPI
ncbi:uncharacterized protein LOC109842878, partial [Asparagus officinalis]|uniref:uncharacterized protein LOC109842878 n=1 Tax=Asparagus officinalis TaxID=4686 RepID=UPI00098E2922